MHPRDEDGIRQPDKGLTESKWSDATPKPAPQPLVVAESGGTRHRRDKERCALQMDVDVTLASMLCHLSGWRREKTFGRT